jgi:large subunit ribosomal protein L19
MQKKLVEFNLKQRQKDVPELKTGDVVKVHRRLFEGGKELSQIFEGMIIAVKGRQSASPMITVRKVSHGVGSEIIIPMYSPMIKKIEVVKSARTKRSKLYYVREKSAKSLKFKYTDAAKAPEVKKAKKSKKAASPAGEEEAKSE